MVKVYLLSLKYLIFIIYIETPLFRCPHGRCKYTAKLEYMIRRHIQKKHDRYACDKCRPHQCSICGRGFARKDGLARHEIVHTKARPFSCSEPGCEYKAAQKNNLKIHIERHHRHRVVDSMITIDALKTLGTVQ